MSKKKGSYEFFTIELARELVKRGVYSNVEQAMSRLRHGHSRRKTCPMTRKPFHEEQKIIFSHPGGSGRIEGTFCSECHELLEKRRVHTAD